jgi:SAM-dependent methyltransferase
MYVMLDDVFRDKIVCPICKTGLSWDNETECYCISCGLHFTSSDSGVWNFIIEYPRFIKSSDYHAWAYGQVEYETWADNLGREDKYEDYISEIDSVIEIYKEEFQLSGTILDVGGGHGRLRHFLSSSDSYLSVDPWVGAFKGLELQLNLLRAYPCLSEPCNFLCAQGERLPLQAASFDYVHIRSALDHLFDPYLSLLEARRVLRHEGGLMIGLHVAGGASAIHAGSALGTLVSRLRKKIRDEGTKAVVNACISRVTGHMERDVHIWHPTYSELLDLLKLAHFEVEKIHWQKPPNDHVVYLLARKV